MPASADDRADAINSFFAAYDKAGSPGCAVAVVHRGEVIHRRGYGRAQLEWDAPITPKTVFHVASVAKQFTAMAVCLLAEEGRLSLDDDVRKYVHELPDRGAVITLRHLLQHSSGLHDVAEVTRLAGWRSDDVVTDRDGLELAIRQEALDFAPGERHVYCNSGYVLAALVVRRVSGQSLRAFAQKRIFEPLGMRDTHFHDDHAEVVKGRASAYSGRGDRFVIDVPNFDTVGSTGLFTTVDDLVRWDRNFADRRVGGKSALERMLTPGTLNSGAPVLYGEGQGYGLGLVLGRYRGLRTVWHSGGDHGYRAEFLRFPEQDFTVIVLGNSDTLNPYFLARRVADVCLKNEFPEGPDRGAKRTARTGSPLTLSEAELTAWAGTYWNLDTGSSWKIAVKDGKLRAGLAPLTPLAADRFGIGDYPIELIFSPAKDGAPRRLEWVDVGTEVFEALPELNPTPGELGEYVGIYRSVELNTEYTLRRRGATLSVCGWRDDHGTLRPVLADVFSISPRGLPTALVRFTRSGGTITGFTLSTERCKAIRFVRSNPPPAATRP